MREAFLNIGRHYLSRAMRRRLVRLTRWPPVGWVRFGNLRRLKPISPDWGMERGQPIDRYYIDNFLSACAGDIRGRVLEIGEDRYTREFGAHRVEESVVLHVAEQKDRVTIIDDLTTGAAIPDNSFDCVILTQTLQAIFDVPAALKTVYRILKPGGVALVTVPGISKISRYDRERWGYYWSFTDGSLEALFTAEFPVDSVTIEAHGNVLASIAFLMGLAREELARHELEYRDPDYQLVLTVRAVKPGSGA